MLLGVILVLAASDPASAAGCKHSRLVLVGGACIELPCEYQGIGVHAFVDQLGGVFKSTRTNERIDWMMPVTAWWLRLPEPFRVIWKRPAIHDWHLSWSALVDWKGQQLYLVTH